MVKRDDKLMPRVVIPVDLFGQPADYVARSSPSCAGKPVSSCSADTAQGFGGDAEGHEAPAPSAMPRLDPVSFPPNRSAAMATAARSSPTTTRLAELLRSIRIHGQGSHRYENVRIGVELAPRYHHPGGGAAARSSKSSTTRSRSPQPHRAAATTSFGPLQPASSRCSMSSMAPNSTWAQYTIQVPDRDKLQADLKAMGIPTAVYYPIPLSRQKGYAHFPSAPIPTSGGHLQHGDQPADASLPGHEDTG